MKVDVVLQTPQLRPKPLSLNFEVSPADQPMFDAARNTSNSSKVEVSRTSPIAVPTSAKQAGPGSHSTPPGGAPFMVGTVPDSPAPLLEASVQESIISQARPRPISVPTNQSLHTTAMVDSLPTPMPGTNMPLEDLQSPVIVLSHHPETVVTQHPSRDYFGCPLDKSGDELQRIDSVIETSDQQRTGLYIPGLAGEEDSPQASNIQPDAISGRLQPVRTNETPLPDPENDPFSLDPELPKSLEDKCVFAYLALEEAGDKQGRLQRRQSKWGRHTGLYDGSGYDFGDLTPSTTHDISLSASSDTSVACGCALEVTSSDCDQAPETRLPTTQSKQDRYAAPNSDDSEPAEHNQLQTGQPPFVDEKEALQEIILAYCSPLFCQGDSKERALEFRESLSEEDTEADLDGIKAKAREEIALSLRIMNRSLGG
ncbi:hypothetical protein K469DRAFT_720047 [Zopfia rhizophila CBS 207.26]|uniref:Uncharacterized protein n=1 Tax=Zopfia rhizophila CBS 207.26 TaxID=1314779 RepID=A0A6A6EJG5_9PEZI|nr:hypothetical protein K469DRAFT_720047 [Zopfia rhizophila CBS 207.26]